jgi:hypothetical protein
VRPAELKSKTNFPLREKTKETFFPVAIYHLSVKTISRSQGRSATAAAAYRAADSITDERTGEIHDYTRKGGVEYTEIFLPDNAPNWATDRSALWNAAEQSETRKNSTVAREFEIALPSELSEKERQKLAVTFAKEIVERHGVAADIAIHEPSRGGDNRNHHAHILITTRQLSEEGFTKKTRELDDRKSGEVERWRERFAELQNESFKKNGINETVDHRTLKAQGIDREPTKHLGITATNYERRTGESSRKRYDFEKDTAARLKLAKETGDLEREVQQLERSTVIISNNLQQAKQAKVEVVAQSQLAEYMIEARKEWRKAESDKLLKQAEEKRLQAWALKHDEPSHLLGLFATEKRKKWEFDIQQTIDEHTALKKQAKDAIEGLSPQERTRAVQSLIEQKARELLKNNSPELDQALKDKAAREQQARRDRLREEQREQELKRSRSKDKDQDLER